MEETLTVCSGAVDLGVVEKEAARVCVRRQIDARARQWHLVRPSHVAVLGVREADAELAVVGEAPAKHAAVFEERKRVLLRSRYDFRY